VVASRLWVADVDGEEHRFCSERCEELYETYVVPQRHGEASA
jgi:ribosomal protein L24E